LWEVLWPDRTDAQLRNDHCDDVTQLFAHFVSGAAASLTVDHAFHVRAQTLAEAFGLRVLTPDQGWETLQLAGLPVPAGVDLSAMWRTRAAELQAFGINVGAHAGRSGSYRHPTAP
jgi:hypothetical protein